MGSAFGAMADEAGDFVSDGVHEFGKIVGGIWGGGVVIDDGDLLSDSNVGHVGQIYDGAVHADPAEDGKLLLAEGHDAAVGERSEISIVVADGDDAYARAARGDV